MTAAAGATRRYYIHPRVMRITCAPPTVRVNGAGEGRGWMGEVGLVGRLLGDGITHQHYIRVPLHKTYLLLYRILVECMTAGVEAQGARIRHVVTPLLIWKRESRSYGSMAAASSASTRRSRRFVNGELHSFARSSIVILY